ncbi:DNA polymerase beta superfamily protein [Sphingobacterium prati]|uniref:DNA polymerase beta superfamily protein n=1 Tax=Sphingobacterium prati TaxID=2737006 RepID=UPI001554ABDF|nr:nucleotidyltransferase domain-containing protein [Sphingobacterium prati]NPE44957.1 nucleotidyltransferase [Sphingobacterium prati]
MTIDELRKSGLILFEAVVGSRAYGLATASSDTDIKGVFYLPLEYYLGGQYIAQVANASNDEVYYELGRFVELLSKSNPTVLELLASPADCILHKDSLFDQFKMQDFITREAAMTFAQYAMVQVRKAKGLNKKINNPMDRERKSLLDFCFIIAGHGSLSLRDWLSNRHWKQENCGLAKIEHAKGMYALFYDQSEVLGYKGIVATLYSTEVSLSSIPKEETGCAYLFVNHDAYSSYCKAYNEYFSWVSARNEARFEGTMNHGQGYDAKNMMHTIRLLQQAKEILSKSELQIQRPNREELLRIKNGTYSYDELFVWSHKLFGEVQELSLHSLLPVAPDQHRLRQRLVDMRKQLYQIKL